MSSTPRPGRPQGKEKIRDKQARTRITIPLNSKPRDYVPGSGPALQPLSLVPPQDSTAYIVERILLPSPGTAQNGKPLPKRMSYIVGWEDMPAARLLVPALDILDYVSPHALEDWEWRLEMELDAEKVRLEEELKKEAEAKIPIKKKRGRPPVHSQIEAAVVAEPETEAVAKSRMRKGAMSLSTPSKAAPEAFEGLSDEESSPSRQLQRDMGRLKSESGTTSEDVEMVDYESELNPTESEHGTTGLQPQLRNGHGTQRALAFAAQPLQKSEEMSDVSSSTPSRWTSIPPLTASEAARSSTMPGRPTGQWGVMRSSTPKQTWNALGGRRAGTTASSSKGSSPAAGPRTAGSASIKKHKTKTTASNPKPAPRKKRNAPQEDSGEGQWEVKRIEGSEWFDVEGNGTKRFFRVRWEGNWPADQNPSWEPEENVPASLVRNYFKQSKRSRKRLGKAAVSAVAGKGPLRQSTLSWAQGRQYSSVSEAFEGEEVEQKEEKVPMAGMGLDGVQDAWDDNELRGDNEDDGDEEEVFVVAEEQPLQPMAQLSWEGRNGNGTRSVF